MAGEQGSGIVVGVDGTAAGRAALTFAVREANRRGGGLDVVTAWTWAGPYDELLVTSPQEARTRAERIQDEAITAVARELAGFTWAEMTA